MTLSKMDYWRLADELSVVDAAILITGNDPSETYEAYTNEEEPTVQRDANGHIIEVQRKDYEGYSTSFKALKNAIMSNSLKATIRLPMRTALHPHLGEDDVSRSENFDDFATGREEAFGYDMLVSRIIGVPTVMDEEYLEKGLTYANFDISSLEESQFLYVSKEPNWEETTISVSDLKTWLEGKGLHPEFFFPQKPSMSLKDRNDPRYSAKLAACIGAWENVKTSQGTMSVKQTLKEWLKSNAANYGVGKDGIVHNKTAEALATVVNWNLKGGATPTPSQNDTLPKEQEVVENHLFTSLEDSEIPF